MVIKYQDYVYEEWKKKGEMKTQFERQNTGKTDVIHYEQIYWIYMNGNANNSFLTMPW